MDLRVQLTVVRRHWLLILQAIILAAAVAGFVAHSQTPSYETSAQVLLIPGDPTESITPAQAPSDITQYANLQAQLVTNPSVAADVAKQLKASDPSKLAGQVTVASGNILAITAKDPNPKRAAQIANAFAQGYLDYSRNTIINGLRRTTAQLQTQIGALQAQLNTRSLSEAAKDAILAQYQTVYSQYVTATVNLSLAGPNAQILAPAGVPTDPTGTPLVQVVLFGAVAGLLLGLGGAFLREQLDDRVRSREDAAHASGDLPVLAEVSSNRRTVRTIEGGGLESAMATQLGEAARSLRTAIMFFGVRGEERRILVTSPGAGDGKTLISTLLAATFAQAGYRTLLISADLRRPGVEQLFGQAGREDLGLTDALLLSRDTEPSEPGDSRSRLAGYLRETSLPNLSILPAGSIAPNPGELLGSQRMDDLLEELSRSHDMLILDSAPLLPVADSRTLAEKVDGVLLVASLGQSKRDVARARETLGQADVKWLGLVLNRVSDSGTDPYHELRTRPVKV